MTKLWTQNGLLHIQDDDHRVAAPIEEVIDALGDDFAKMIAKKLRDKKSGFQLMRETVANWLEEGKWKDA